MEGWAVWSRWPFVCVCTCVRAQAHTRVVPCTVVIAHFLWMFMLVVEVFFIESKSDTICPPVPSEANGMGAAGLSFSSVPFRASFFEPTVLWR